MSATTEQYDMYESVAAMIHLNVKCESFAS